MQEFPSSSRDQRPGWTPLLILAGAVTTLNSSVPLGYQIGVINTPAEVIRQFCNESISIVYGSSVDSAQLKTLWSAIVSIFLIGGLIGSFLGGSVADRFGRKGAILINNVIGLVAAILFVGSLYAHSVEMLMLGRLIVGISSGIAMGTVPMYLTEIAPLRLRGAMGVLCPLGLAMGIVLGLILGFKSILGREDTWNFLLAFHGLLIIVAGFGMPFLPESPTYLLGIKKDKEKSTSELCRLRRLQPAQLETELASIEAEHKALEAAAGRYTMWTILRPREFRLPLLLVCTLMAAVQLSGINNVIYYSMDIFLSAGLDATTSEYATLSTGVMELVMCVASVYYVNLIRRRVLVLSSCFLCVFFLILITVTLYHIESTSWVPYLCIAFVLCFVMSFGIALASIPFFFASEIFTIGPRAVAASYGSMVNWLTNFLVAMTFPSLNEAIGAFSFLPYAAAMLIIGAFLWVYMPETKDQTPEYLSRLLEDGFHRNVRARQRDADT